MPNCPLGHPCRETPLDSLPPGDHLLFCPTCGKQYLVTPTEFREILMSLSRAGGNHYDTPRGAHCPGGEHRRRRKAATYE